MEVAQVPDKFLVRNNTAGWVGVVKLDHRGEEKGTSVPPYGSVWLSELEMQVTARAPRLPEDNPFAEQTLILTNPETGARQEYTTRPLTLEHDARRYTPAEERYVPTVDVPKEAVPAQRQEASVPEEITLAPRPGVTSAELPPPTVAPVSPGPAMRRAQGQPTGTPQPPSGQAKPPAQPPPEGEYAQAEEVGSPDAPSGVVNDETVAWE
jgi:hypothetical protein